MKRATPLSIPLHAPRTAREAHEQEPERSRAYTERLLGAMAGSAPGRPSRIGGSPGVGNAGVVGEVTRYAALHRVAWPSVGDPIKFYLSRVRKVASGHTGHTGRQGS